MVTTLGKIALTMLIIHLLSESHSRALANDDDWFNIGHATCYDVYVIMHVKDPYLPVKRVGHCVPLVCFCLSLYDLVVLKKDINMMQTNNM